MCVALWCVEVNTYVTSFDVVWWVSSRNLGRVVCDVRGGVEK